MAGAVDRERSFWNSRGSAYEAVRNLIGRSIGAFSSYGELESTYDPAGRTVLDYGCGRGDDAIRLVQRGAVHVTASTSPTPRSPTPSAPPKRRALPTARASWSPTPTTRASPTAPST